MSRFKNEITHLQAHTKPITSAMVPVTHALLNECHHRPAMHKDSHCRWGVRKGVFLSGRQAMNGENTAAALDFAILPDQRLPGRALADCQQGISC